jgi:hypothetical protein
MHTRVLYIWSLEAVCIACMYGVNPCNSMLFYCACLYMHCACEQAAAVAQDAAKASNSDCTEAIAALNTATAAVESHIQAQQQVCIHITLYHTCFFAHAMIDCACSFVRDVLQCAWAQVIQFWHNCCNSTSGCCCSAHAAAAATILQLSALLQDLKATATTLLRLR